MQTAGSDRIVPKITSYQFGLITIDDQPYQKDVIITPQGVISDWRREQGHSLIEADLDEALARSPKLLIIGTGKYARMHMPEETLLALKRHAIEIIALPTSEACEQYNRLSSQGGVVAALHLTC